MTEKRPDDIRFLINTFAITLVLFAIIATFQPYLENEPKLEDVKRIESRIVTLEPTQLAAMLKSEKPVMLVAYASWCPYCREIMPIVAQMIRNHELDGVTPLFVSLDVEPRPLSRYLVHGGYDKIFSPYVVDHGLSRRISTAMEPSGSHFSGVIPYIGFFDKNGIVQAESVGVVNRSRLMAMAITVTPHLLRGPP